MLVLHAHWQPPRKAMDPGGMVFWAESSEAPAPSHWRGRLPKKFTAKTHPFAILPEELREQIGAGTPLGDAAAARVRFTLPTTRTGPLASPELRHNWDLDDTSSPFLAPWLVDGLILPAAKAFGVLVGLPNTDPGNRFVLGRDLVYWRKVANLVLETLAAQKVLPVVVAIQNGGPAAPASVTPAFNQYNRHGRSSSLPSASVVYQARWLPVLDEPRDATRLAMLAASMPPVCRSESLLDTRAQPIQTPAALVDSFLKSVCDALTRSWGRPAAPRLPASTDQLFRAWMEALFRDDPTLAVSAAQAQTLISSLRAWMRNLTAAGDASFRIAFRLEAPEKPSENSDARDWRLHYHLQARDDLSLLVSAEQVWTNSGNLLTLSGHRFDEPQEKLLAGLGYAARLYPAILPSLQSRRPLALTLDTTQAYTFLREYSPLLQRAGFGILTPPWWNQPNTRLGVRLRLAPSQGKSPDLIASGKLSLDRLVSYQWELSLGDTPLTEAEFKALAALKQPLVHIRGQWVQLDPEQIEAAIHFWKNKSKGGEMSLIQAAQFGLGGEETPNELPLTDVIAEGWVAEWLDRLGHGEKLSELPQPSTLNGQLRPYQRLGYSWLTFFQRWGLGACLADDMGLGKTIQTLALLLREKETNGRLQGPVLLVCPTSVVINWEREVNRFAPSLTTYTHQGAARLRNSEFKQKTSQVDVVLTSYAVLRTDAEVMLSVPWYGVVLDEAQNIKNPAAKVTQTARKLTASFRFALTGTPVENRLVELWSIMNFLNPGYLGPQDSFRRNFSLPIERFGDTDKADRLRKLVGPFILRRVKTDPAVIQDLPDKIETKEYCTLTEEQATLYEATVRDTMAQIADSDGIQRRGLVLTLLMQLKQICNHPVQYLHQVSPELAAETLTGRSGKLMRLVEMVDEVVSENNRALIFTQFAEMGKLLSTYLPTTLGQNVLFLHGGTPPRIREQMVHRFQEDPDGPRVFILSLKAGGTGLNLMNASHVFHFDRWWNPAVEDQATDRAYRIGQVKNVQVHKFITSGTLEEHIDDLIESKKGLADSIIGAGEQWITELSTDELRDLVSLRRTQEQNK